MSTEEKKIITDVQELRNKLWSEALSLTVKIEYAKGYEKAKLLSRYNALKEVWEWIGGDKENVASDDSDARVD